MCNSLLAGNDGIPVMALHMHPLSSDFASLCFTSIWNRVPGLPILQLWLSIISREVHTMWVSTLAVCFVLLLLLLPLFPTRRHSCSCSSSFLFLTFQRPFYLPPLLSPNPLPPNLFSYSLLSRRPSLPLPPTSLTLSLIPFHCFWSPPPSSLSLFPSLLPFPLILCLVSYDMNHAVDD